jgi:hypothetical protein
MVRSRNSSQVHLAAFGVCNIAWFFPTECDDGVKMFKVGSHFHTSPVSLLHSTHLTLLPPASLTPTGGTRTPDAIFGPGIMGPPPGPLHAWPAYLLAPLTHSTPPSFTVSHFPALVSGHDKGS